MGAVDPQALLQGLTPEGGGDQGLVPVDHIYLVPGGVGRIFVQGAVSGSLKQLHRLLHALPLRLSLVQKLLVALAEPACLLQLLRIFLRYVRELPSQLLLQFFSCHRLSSSCHFIVSAAILRHYNSGDAANLQPPPSRLYACLFCSLLTSRIRSLSEYILASSISTMSAQAFNSCCRFSGPSPSNL